MADFLSMLLQNLPSILGNFSGSADPYRQQQERLAAQQEKYAAASANPNDPMYQQLYGQFQQQNHSNLAQVIAEAQGQNRLNSKMGRTPLFSNERGGETTFRALAKGYQDSGAQSDTQTRSALQSAAGIGQQAAQQYATASPWSAIGNYQKQIAGPEGLAALFSGGQSGGGNGYGGYQTVNNAGTQGITWQDNPFYQQIARQQQPLFKGYF